MRADGLLRFLFIIYCVEAGAVLCVAPWGITWGRLVMLLPWAELQPLIAATWTRALITACGVLHLLLALHDLAVWAQRPGPLETS